MANNHTTYNLIPNYDDDPPVDVQTFENFDAAVKNKDIAKINCLIGGHKELFNCKLPPFYDGSVLTRLSANVRRQFFDACWEIFDNEPDEQLFIAAAKLDPSKLLHVINTIQKTSADRAQYVRRMRGVKDCRTVLNFVLKYGDLSSEDFIPCLKILLDKGLDVNRCDFYGKTPIENLCELHISKKISSVVFSTAAQLFLDRQSYVSNDRYRKHLNTQMNCDLAYESEIDSVSKLFNYVSNKDRKTKFTRSMKEEFERLLTNSSDSHDGENTILQMVLIKFDDPSELVELLLKAVDPHAITPRNLLPPIEISALKNQQRTFNLLLKHKDTTVSEDLYNTFVAHRAKKMKTVYFRLLLESNKLSPNYKSRNTGNTPLHYAIIFSHGLAIQNQLVRGASLLLKNSSNKCALDMIRAEDLEHYFDSCLIPDNRYSIEHIEYKMQLNFAALINQTNGNELEVINKIKATPRLKHILEHLLVQIFIQMKWHKSQKYYWLIVLIQTFFFVVLFCLFYHHDQTALMACFVTANVLLKLVFLLVYKRHYCDLVKKYKIVAEHLDNKYGYLSIICGFVVDAYKKTSLHLFMELFCSVIMIIICVPSSFQKELCAVVFPFMTFSFLLTVGYHPCLSEWSLMLQKIVKTFIVLLVFSFPPILAFSLGFNLLFGDQKDANLFHSVGTSILRTFIMITGEFDVYEIEFNTTASFLLLIMLVVFMYAILMNFLTGVAVSDIQQIKDNSKINAIKSVFLFLKTVEKFYRNKYVQFLCRLLGKPYVFENTGANYKFDLKINKEFGDKIKDMLEAYDNKLVNNLRSFVVEHDEEDSDREEFKNLTVQIVKMDKKICDLEKKLDSVIAILKAKESASEEGSLQKSSALSGQSGRKK